MKNINTVIDDAEIDNDWPRTRRRFQIILHAMRRKKLIEIDYKDIESATIENCKEILTAIISRTVNEKATFLVNEGIYDMDWSFVSPHLEIEDCIAYLAENYVPTLCYRFLFPIKTGGHGENYGNVILYKMNLGILEPYQVSREILNMIPNMQGLRDSQFLTRGDLDENEKSIGTDFLPRLSDWARGFISSNVGVDGFLHLDIIHKMLVIFASHNFENALNKPFFSVVPERKKYDDAILAINSFIRNFHMDGPDRHFDPEDDFSEAPYLFDSIEKDIISAQELMSIGKPCNITEMIRNWSDLMSKTYRSSHHQP